MLGIHGAAGTMKTGALDAMSANIMIADAKLNIVYINPATRELLQEAENDLKKELPRFSMATLVGSNIDIFHKNPAHQRSMLAALKKQHRATISVGQRMFDLIVTPLMRAERIMGFVVEWADARARIQNTDYRNQLLAINRVQAVIEFTPAGEIVSANDNFLAAVGYTLAEIKGRNHRIFLEEGEAGDRQFEQLWTDLRANNPHIGDIIRYGKGGRAIYLNASYNPITNDAGKVVKVVKFATDVSERVFAVRTVGDALSKLALGDLSFSLDRHFAKDFEALRENMNSAMQQLGETLASVSRSTGLIDDGAREISDGASNLSRRTEQQAAALEETAAALDEITVNVGNASKRANEARQAAATANDSACRSGQIVADAVGAMARIEESSNSIANIIGVIDEIAFQTNLLALNAGVEAARAGEAGKGFAVVAQEVRELAQRSAKAAKEIKELIRNSSEEVKHGVKLVHETGDALKTIQDNITSVNEHMQAIAVSANEQSTGLSEVNSAVNQMDQVTQQNAAMVEEATASSMTLAQEAERLRQMITRFKLPGQSSYAGAAQSAAMSTNEDAFASFGEPKKIVRLSSNSVARGR
ncbi:methyl-accepting chemotaxis protein [Rhizobium miluonense]|uniref:Methyl-accepting chemotaxis sensory transducer with Pas/Pac sensor n=1 Tax=Rhizobium miluonense TaxID=411945 RepID=A0A1C3VEX2_9HYPH|nr:PAS domain-containing methyl-accepting chemotaxis protein [Rhizobium miluonense]SCB26333.1 methyl-accepting chemotaxis sensory transducer with Pas/Pac sensor [Rhizobium miluonense]